MRMHFSPDELAVLRGVVLLAELTDAEFRQAIRAGRILRKADGAYFFMEEDVATCAYVVVSGKVKLTQTTIDGQQVIFGYLNPGREFGIISLLDQGAYPVSAQAVGDSMALCWEHTVLNQLMHAQPRIAYNAMHIMARQIKEFQSQVRDLSTQRVEQRIARAVLRLARQSGRKTDSGILIDLPLTRQDLAEMTGTTLYSVSRVLTDWEKRGLVQSKRQQVLILVPHSLVAIAEDLPPTKINSIPDGSFL